MRYSACPIEPLTLHVGDKVRFVEEHRTPYTVRAISPNFVLLTRQAPFRPKGEYLYTVMDWRNGVRGPINVIGQGWDCATDEACQELIALLEGGEWEVSQRNWLPIQIGES